VKLEHSTNHFDLTTASSEDSREVQTSRRPNATDYASRQGTPSNSLVRLSTIMNANTEHRNGRLPSQNRQGHSLQVPGGEMTRAPGQRDDDSIDQGPGARRSTSRVSPPRRTARRRGKWEVGSSRLMWRFGVLIEMA